jgi:hypothetical protein
VAVSAHSRLARQFSDSAKMWQDWFARICFNVLRLIFPFCEQILVNTYQTFVVSVELLLIFLKKNIFDNTPKK